MQTRNVEILLVVSNTPHNIPHKVITNCVLLAPLSTY